MVECSYDTMPIHINNLFIYNCSTIWVYCNDHTWIDQYSIHPNRYAMYAKNSKLASVLKICWLKNEVEAKAIKILKQGSNDSIAAWIALWESPCFGTEQIKCQWRNFLTQQAILQYHHLSLTVFYHFIETFSKNTGVFYQKCTSMLLGEKLWNQSWQPRNGYMYCIGHHL